MCLYLYFLSIGVAREQRISLPRSPHIKRRWNKVMTEHRARVLVFFWLVELGHLHRHWRGRRALRPAHFGERIQRLCVICPGPIGLIRVREPGLLRRLGNELLPKSRSLSRCSSSECRAALGAERCRVCR